MFSGIVQSLKPITKTEEKNGHLFITVKKPSSWKTKLGESICLNGICSTICKQTKTSFTFEHMPETIRLTAFNKNIPACQSSSQSEMPLVNLERSLKLNDLVGGHLVSGHVDCTGTISNIKKDKDSKIFTLKFPAKYNKFIINKGSITINGVSLTIFDKNKIALIQHTLENTNLGNLKINDKVNLEFDLIGKYVHRISKV